MGEIVDLDSYRAERRRRQREESRRSKRRRADPKDDDQAPGRAKADPAQDEPG